MVVREVNPGVLGSISPIERFFLRRVLRILVFELVRWDERGWLRDFRFFVDFERGFWVVKVLFSVIFRDWLWRDSILL